MLKFFPKILVCTEQFPLLKGARGMFLVIIPTILENTDFTSLQRGRKSCKLWIFVQKINALKFAKQNLTALAFKGGEKSCKFSNFVQKINVKKFAKQNLTALLKAGVIGSSIFRFLLVRICNPQPLFTRLWRVVAFITLARGEKNIGCGQNVLTSRHYFLEPITPALKV